MRIFITGMSGTLGTALAKLHSERGDQVFGCARDEERCQRWIDEYHRYGTLYCCDCADLAVESSDICRLLPTVSRVYHCAAMKHVDLCEQNPYSASYQNVAITQLLSSLCEEEGIPFYFVSSDKACLPQGVYGASKLLAERIVVKNGGAAVRFGNLIGSSGSVFQRWQTQAIKGLPISVTSPAMTRYFLPVGEAAEFLVNRCALGAVTVPHRMRAASIREVAEYVAKLYRVEVLYVGKRAGETDHQYLAAPGSLTAADGDRTVLSDTHGDVLRDGLSSDRAERWDTAALLREAGIPDF